MPTVLRTSSLLATLLLFACAAPRPAELGVRDGRLLPCPDSPNCVSSDATDEQHGIAGFAISGDADEAWAAAAAAVAKLPRTVIVRDTGEYLHAESTTAIMRYIDDVELQLRRDDGVIATSVQRFTPDFGWKAASASLVATYTPVSSTHGAPRARQSRRQRVSPSATSTQ